jgi:(p)ppGpp synthase/HD superfamily hydrolase
MKTELEKAVSYAIKCHESTNHTYDGRPYSIHLEMVFNIALEHISIIPLQHRDTVLSACWAHDVIEDCRETYNDVASVLGTDVAEIVYALSNEKGKTRKERANDKYYKGIKNCPFASFVKLCDRIANIQYSKYSGSSMFDKYISETPDFVHQLYSAEYSPLFLKMYDLINTK